MGLHEDTRSDHKSSSLSVVEMMFAVFTHGSPTMFFQYFQMCVISPTNNINKNATSELFAGISLLNKVMTPMSCHVYLSS